MKLSKKSKKLAKSASFPTLSLTLAACEFQDLFQESRSVNYNFPSTTNSTSTKSSSSGTSPSKPARKFDKTYFGTDKDEHVVGDSSRQDIDGAGGKDVVFYEDSDEGVTVELSLSTGYGGHAEGDRYLNVENIVGSAHNDKIIGNRDENIFDGREGDDILNGRGGNDTLLGGAGNDFILGEEGDDIINAGDGDDEINGGNGDDKIAGGAGRDDIDGGEGIDNVGIIEMEGNPNYIVNLKTGKGFGGNVEGDTYKNIENIDSNASNGTLIGTDDRNIFTTLKSHMTINGEGGDDVISGTHYAIIDGGAGNDLIRVEDFANINGGDGTDLIFAKTATIANGGLGDDLLIAGRDSVLHGNEGDDAIGLGEDGSDKTKTLVYGDEGEDIITTKSIATIFGGADNDTITADYDVIANGDGGDDTINVKTFSEVNGGTGDDQIKMSNPDDAPDLDLMTIDGISGLSGQILGGAGNDKLTLEGINFDHFEIMQAENKILLHATKENEPTKEVDILISSIETLDHNGSDIDIKDIWSQLNATEQAKFNDNEAEFTTWLSQDTGFNYEGL